MADPVAVTETTIRGVKKAIQDFVAPEIRDLKGNIAEINTRLGGIEKLIETQYKALSDKMETQYKAFSDKQDAQFNALMAAIGESRAKSELEAFKMVSALSERVAVLEAARP